ANVESSVAAASASIYKENAVESSDAPAPSSFEYVIAEASLDSAVPDFTTIIGGEELPVFDEAAEVASEVADVPEKEEEEEEEETVGSSGILGDPYWIDDSKAEESFKGYDYKNTNE
ncbi:hypothetical protein ABG067_009205, partial [Albugo candida]